MPNRYIRAAAIESESVNSLSWQGEVFYRRLLNRADDFGRYTGNLALLRASLFPLQTEKVSVADVGRVLAECESSGLAFGYQVDGKPYLVLNKWEKGRAKYSEYPEPPPDICERMRTHVFICKHMPPTPIPTLTPIPTPTPSQDGPRKTPSLEQVLAAANTGGVPKEIAEAFFHRHEARPISPTGHWTDKDGNTVAKWQSAMKSFAVSWQSNDRQREQSHAHQTRNSSSPGRNNAQSLRDAASEYGEG